MINTGVNMQGVPGEGQKAAFAVKVSESRVYLE